MTITCWRIIKAKYAATAFTGTGAKIAGGRWNSPGVPVVYVAGSAALAMLEMLVHIQSQELLRRYVQSAVTFDDALMAALPAENLPTTWRRSPPSPALQRIGDEWVRAGRAAVLRVPSVIVPAEWNYLLNPTHKDFARIAIGPRRPAPFDPRLIEP